MNGSAARLFAAMIVCVTVLTTGSQARAAAPAPDSRGTDFVVAFPQNSSGTQARTLLIGSMEAATGTVASTRLGFATPFSVAPGTVTAVNLPSAVELFGPGYGSALRLTADRDVTVYTLSTRTGSIGSYLALPTDAIGKRHTVMAWGGGIRQSGFPSSQLVVAPSASSTNLTIVPASNTVDGRIRGVAFKVNVSAGDAYQVTASPGGDLTGSLVTSDKPVAVFGGHACANIPEDVFACDQVVEQQPPDTAWGRVVATVPLKHRLGGDTVRILASEDDTEVRIDGASVASLDAGQFHTQLIAGPSMITAGKPVLVAQFANSSEFDHTMAPFMSDPAMMLVAPVAEYATDYIVSTMSGRFTQNTLNIVAPTASVGAVAIDGTPVAPSDYVAIGAGELWAAQVDVAPGSHVVTGAGEPFAVTAYGANVYESYAHPAGMRVAGAPYAASLTLDPSGEALRVGTVGCVTATVRDQRGDAFAGAPVSFRVTGANTASGSVAVDAGGKASFCYTGSRIGSDTVFAAVGRVTGYAAKMFAPAEAPPTVAPPPPPPPPPPSGTPSASGGSSPPATATDALRLVGCASAREAFRVAGARVTSTTAPRRDTTRPYTFTTTGRLEPPASCAALPRSELCSGAVTIRFKRTGPFTVSSRRTSLRADCSYVGRVTFMMRRRLSRRPLRVHARFEGNGFLLPVDAAVDTVVTGGQSPRRGS